MNHLSFVLLSLGLTGLIVMALLLHARHEKTDVLIMLGFSLFCLGGALLGGSLELQPGHS